MTNRRSFVAAMRKHLDPGLPAYDDALAAAIAAVDSYVRDRDLIYFGWIGVGSFYLGPAPGSARWMPGVSPFNALILIRDQLGDDAIAGIGLFEDDPEFVARTTCT